MKIFHFRPPPYYILRWRLKKMTWKRFHFLWIISQILILIIIIIDTDYHWEFTEPVAHVSETGTYERHAHVSVFRFWLVKKITKIVKSFTKIVKLFTQLLSISKLFWCWKRLQFSICVTCEGFHKVPRKFQFT